MTRWNPCRFAVLVLIAPGLSLAQYDPGASYQIATNNVAFTQSVLMTSELARVGQQAYTKRESRGNQRIPVAKQHSGGLAAPSLRVGNDPGISAQVWAEFIDGVHARSGKRVSDEIQALFRRKDVRTTFNETAGPFGLRADDYGDVLAGYLVALWMTANQAPIPSVAQVQSVNGQVHGQLARTGVNATSRQLQMQAEQMMYEVVATIYARQQAERTGNRRVLEDMAGNAQKNFLARGLDLQAMILKEGSGLIRR